MSELTEDATRLVETAVFGKQIEDFMGSAIGKYLMERIDAEIAEGLRELKDVNAFDPNAVRAAQNKVWRGEQLQGWLLQAMEAGLTAIQVLDSHEEIT
jgi:hypothetical protein